MQLVSIKSLKAALSSFSTEDKKRILSHYFLFRLPS